MSNITDLYEMLADGSEVKVNKAIEIINTNCYPRIKRFVLNNNGNEADAQDLMQEGMIVLYDNIMLNKFRRESSIDTYLFSICKNKWYSELRLKQKQKNRENLNVTNQHDNTEVDDNLINEILSVLSDDCRKILRAFYFNQLTMRDIMQIFNLKTEQSAKNKKYLCMKKLVEEIRSRNLNIESFIKTK